mmetsp:Transcript_37771/g.68350  ORF Transcript_37771/g.68350 Transcript_37771/m.68350 type:complete len:201 (-) Transcript_37771:1562-2164(-)
MCSDHPGPGCSPRGARAPRPARLLFLPHGLNLKSRSHLVLGLRKQAWRLTCLLPGTRGIRLLLALTVAVAAVLQLFRPALDRPSTVWRSPLREGRSEKPKQMQKVGPNAYDKNDIAMWVNEPGPKQEAAYLEKVRRQMKHRYGAVAPNSVSLAVAPVVFSPICALLQLSHLGHPLRDVVVQTPPWLAGSKAALIVGNHSS